MLDIAWAVLSLGGGKDLELKEAVNANVVNGDLDVLKWARRRRDFWTSYCCFIYRSKYLFIELKIQFAMLKVLIYAVFLCSISFAATNSYMFISDLETVIYWVISHAKLRMRFWDSSIFQSYKFPLYDKAQKVPLSCIYESGRLSYFLTHMLK